MKKVLSFFVMASFVMFMNSCNGTSSAPEAEENVEAEAPGNGVQSVSAGPGENKPCHVSSCSCKFGYGGNWDAQKCNKCGHSMSNHY